MPNRVSTPITFALIFATSACVAAVTQGPDAAKDGQQPLSRVIDPSEAYRGVGLMATARPVPFVASIQFLAGPSSDSTLALFGLSLANEALTFRRVNSQFEAWYQVEIVCTSDEEVLARGASEEVVRVATYVETQRRDESVVFQKFFHLPPGAVTAAVVVKDRFSGDSTWATQQWRVPRVGTGSVDLSYVAVYEGARRYHVASGPAVVVNPRAYAAYGLDTLTIYLEGYGIESAAVATVRVVDAWGGLLWQDTVGLSGGTAGLGTAFVGIPAGQLMVGEVTLEARLTDRAAPVRSKALVGLSPEWPPGGFAEFVSLLRYFGTERSREALEHATPLERSNRWMELWNDTDPDPATPGNEALYQYLNDVAAANSMFAEARKPGWLTERGRVYLTLGQPDEIREIRDDPTAGGQRLIRWQYGEGNLTLYFVTDGGLGYQLTPTSRVEYAEAMERKREAKGG